MRSLMSILSVLGFGVTFRRCTFPDSWVACTSLEVKGDKFGILPRGITILNLCLTIDSPNYGLTTYSLFHIADCILKAHFVFFVNFCDLIYNNFKIHNFV